MLAISRLEFEQQFPFACRTLAPRDQVVPWCEANFGEFGLAWYRLGSDIAMGIEPGLDIRDTYCFRHSEAAVAFRLKWC